MKPQSEPLVMLVHTGSIKPADKAALRKAGIVVAECEHPNDVRFVRAPDVEVSGGAMLAAVLVAVKERIKAGHDSYLAASAYRAIADTIVNAHAAPPKQSDPKQDAP